MNKEVIYLEPEDDITDILTKLQQAEQKLVALVPPKKATMLRSAVNMKLVARVAKECDKVAVIVTADPAIIKLAMAAKIPVAKTLQSRPMVPTAESVRASELDEQVIDEESGDFIDDDPKSRKANAKIPTKASKITSEGSSVKGADTFDLTEESLENDSKDAKTDKKTFKKAPKSASDKKVPSFDKYRKWVLFGLPAALITIVVLVWALVFAPAATITVAISSAPENISENIKFTTDPAAENLEEGIFLVEKQSLEEKYTVDNVDTASKEDRGEKAKGNVTITYSFPVRQFQGIGFAYYVPEGTILTTADGREYRTTEKTDTLRWDGDALEIVCNTTLKQLSGTCVKTFTVPVEAVAPGEDYNISGSVSWDNYDEDNGVSATVRNSGAITGGTTKMEKVISQADADGVKDAQVAEHTREGKEHLLEDISKDLIVVDGSFKAEGMNVESTPAIGDVVGDNTKPIFKVTAEYSIYAVERSKVEEYIKSKVTLGDDCRIYSTGDPYIERYTSIDEPARLKTTVEIGPTVNEETIFEKAKGHKTGEVKSLLSSINGVSSVEVRTPYFWVWSVPNDRDKVTINLTVEDK